MKAKISFIICILFTYIAFGQIPNRLANSDKRGVINSEIINKQNFIVNFYKIYCENIAKNNETTALTENILSKRLLEKVRNYGVDYGYNIIIDAQDFNEKSIETISALHIKGDLFVVSYFDYYSKKCVIIILKVINNNETYMIEDIVIGSQN